MDLRFGHSWELIGYVTRDAELGYITDLAGLGGSHFALSVEDIAGSFVVMVSKGAKILNPLVEVSEDTSVCYLKDHVRKCIEFIKGKNSD